MSNGKIVGQVITKSGYLYIIVKCLVPQEGATAKGLKLIGTPLNKYQSTIKYFTNELLISDKFNIIVEYIVKRGLMLNNILTEDDHYSV